MCKNLSLFQTMKDNSKCSQNKHTVYSPFSDKVGLPLHNNPFPGVLMKGFAMEQRFLRPDALPDVNHMYGMQYIAPIAQS